MSVDPLGGLPQESDRRAETEPPPEPLARRRPASTIALLGILAAFFLAEILVSGDPAGEDTWTLFRLGALYPPAVRNGDFWRIGSYAFLHIGWLHIVFNGTALWALMPQLEATFGSNLAVGLFSATALAGGAASVLWRGDQPVLAAGASGGIFGLFGATMALFWRVRARLPPEVRRRVSRGILSSVFMNAVIAFALPVDNAAHVGGAAAGLLFGLLAPLPMLPQRVWQRPVRWLLLGSAFVLFAMEGIAVAWAVRPKTRTLQGEGVVAQVPGMAIPTKPGKASFRYGLGIYIGREREPLSLTPGEVAIRIGDRTWVRERSRTDDGDHTLLLSPEGGGRLRIEMLCWSPACAGGAGDRMIEQVARSLHTTP